MFPGVGMDSCVIPLRHGGLSLVQTTDFFYPLVEDPYMMVSYWQVFFLCESLTYMGTLPSFVGKVSKS